MGVSTPARRSWGNLGPSRAPAFSQGMLRRRLAGLMLDSASIASVNRTWFGINAGGPLPGAASNLGVRPIAEPGTYPKVSAGVKVPVGAAEGRCERRSASGTGRTWSRRRTRIEGARGRRPCRYLPGSEPSGGETVSGNAGDVAGATHHCPASCS